MKNANGKSNNTNARQGVNAVNGNNHPVGINNAHNPHASGRRWEVGLKWERTAFAHRFHFICDKYREGDFRIVGAALPRACDGTSESHHTAVRLSHPPSESTYLITAQLCVAGVRWTETKLSDAVMAPGDGKLVVVKDGKKTVIKTKAENGEVQSKVVDLPAESLIFFEHAKSDVRRFQVVAIPRASTTSYTPPIREASNHIWFKEFEEATCLSIGPNIQARGKAYRAMSLAAFTDSRKEVEEGYRAEAGNRWGLKVATIKRLETENVGINDPLPAWVNPPKRVFGAKAKAKKEAAEKVRQALNMPVIVHYKVAADTLKAKLSPDFTKRWVPSKKLDKAVRVVSIKKKVAPVKDSDFSWEEIQKAGSVTAAARSFEVANSDRKTIKAMFRKDKKSRNAAPYACV